MKPNWNNIWSLINDPYLGNSIPVQTQNHPGHFQNDIALNS